MSLAPVSDVAGTQPGEGEPTDLLVPESTCRPLAVPAELKGLRSLLWAFEERHFPPAIYFLVKSGRVVYVGQSLSLAQRILNHRGSKKFDFALWMHVPRPELALVEGALIRLLKPELNGYGPVGCGSDEQVLATIIQRAAAVESHKDGDSNGGA